MDGKREMSLQGGPAIWQNLFCDYGSRSERGKTKAADLKMSGFSGELGFMHGRQAIKSNYSGCGCTRRMRIISHGATLQLRIFKIGISHSG